MARGAPDEEGLNWWWRVGADVAGVCIFLWLGWQQATIRSLEIRLQNLEISLAKPVQANNQHVTFGPAKNREDVIEEAISRRREERLKNKEE